MASVCKNLILWAVWPQNWLHPSSVHIHFPPPLPFTPYDSPNRDYSSPHFHSYFPHPVPPLSYSPIPPPFSIFLHKNSLTLVSPFTIFCPLLSPSLPPLSITLSLFLFPLSASASALSYFTIPPPFSIFLHKIPSHLSPLYNLLSFTLSLPSISSSSTFLPPLSLYVGYLLTVSLPSVSPSLPSLFSTSF